jgi:hypothetical protein
MSNKNDKHIRVKGAKPQHTQPVPDDAKYLRLHPEDRQLLLDVLEALKSNSGQQFDPKKIMDNLRKDVRTGEPIKGAHLTESASDLD